jgi:hypothetical protein
MNVTACYVVPPDASQEERYQADVWIDKTLERFADGGGVEKLLIESSSVAGGIAKASRDYDLVVLGAAKERRRHCRQGRPLLSGQRHAGEAV